MVEYEHIKAYVIGEVITLLLDDQIVILAKIGFGLPLVAPAKLCRIISAGYHGTAWKLRQEHFILSD